MKKLVLLSLPLLLCISLVSAIKVFSPYIIYHDSIPVMTWYTPSHYVLSSREIVSEAEEPPRETTWTEAMYIESNQTSGVGWSCVDCDWAANSYAGSHGTNVRRTNAYPDTDTIAFTVNTSDTYWLCYTGYESDHLGYFDTVVSLNDTGSTTFTWIDTGIRKPGGDITGWWKCGSFTTDAQQSFQFVMTSTPAHVKGIFDAAVVTNNLTLVDSLNATWSIADNTTWLTPYSYLEGDV